MKKIFVMLMGVLFCGGCYTTQIVKSEKKCAEFTDLDECTIAKKCMPVPSWEANKAGDYVKTLACVKKRPYHIRDIGRNLR